MLSRFWTAFSVVVFFSAFFSASTRADGILDVSAWVTFSATTQPYCSATCAETIKTNFDYFPVSEEHSLGGIVPGTMHVSASGFLGQFSDGSFGGDFIAFPDSGGDEMNILIPFGSPLLPQGIQPGVNTVNFFLWACQSQACGNAYGETWINDEIVGSLLPGSYTFKQGSVATPISTPEPPTTWLLALGAALFTVVLKWKTLLH
jgi:hypothetical protein